MDIRTAPIADLAEARGCSLTDLAFEAIAAAHHRMVTVGLGGPPVHPAGAQTRLINALSNRLLAAWTAAGKSGK